jgi:hypothetical protein
MSVYEIPKSFKYVCDVCGAAHVQENANGHYTDSRPPRWGYVDVRQALIDLDGDEVGDASVSHLLCQQCLPVISKAIKDAAKTRSAK